MRVYDLGSFFAVTVSEREVDDFNRRWPCSTLSGRQRFEFDKRDGNLVDHVGRGDGGEAVALSEDAQAYGCLKLGIRNWHEPATR